MDNDHTWKQTFLLGSCGLRLMSDWYNSEAMKAYKYGFALFHPWSSVPGARRAQGTRGFLLSQVWRSRGCVVSYRGWTSSQPAYQQGFPQRLQKASQLHLTDAQIWSLYLDLLKAVGRGKNLGWWKGSLPLMIQEQQQRHCSGPGRFSLAFERNNGTGHQKISQTGKILLCGKNEMFHLSLKTLNSEPLIK